MPHDRDLVRAHNHPTKQELLVSGTVTHKVQMVADPLVLAALTRIEAKLGDSGDAALQQKVNDLTRELKQRNDELAAVVAASPKET